MRDDVVGRTQRATLLFIGCVTLAVAMFAAGVFIGKWTSPTASRVESLPSQATSSEAAERTSLPSASHHQASPEVGGFAGTPEPPESPSKTEQADEPASYLIHAGSFSSQQQAERLIARLKAWGVDRAFMRSRVLSEGTTVVDVLLGPFADEEEATRLVRELRNNGLTGLQIVPTR